MNKGDLVVYYAPGFVHIGMIVSDPRTLPNMFRHEPVSVVSVLWSNRPKGYQNYDEIFTHLLVPMASLEDRIVRD